MMTTMNWDELETLREGWDFEAKLAGGRTGRGAVPESLWTTYSAMANTEGGVSEPRNPALQRLFGFLRLGEREGSGGPMVRRIWHEQHWRAPRIWEDVQHNETHLELSRESLFPEWAVGALVERWGPAFTNRGELGRIILTTAEIEGPIDHGRIRELSDAHPCDITLELQDLVRQGLLESSGRARGTKYGPSGLDEVESTSQSGPSSPHKGAELPHKGAKLPHKGAKLPHKGAKLPRKGAKLPHKGAELPRGQQPNAGSQALAAKRAHPEDMRAAIISLCGSEFRTASELAAILDRRSASIQQHYISKMLAAGELEARYPDTPSHPKQAYRARRPTETD